LPIVTTPSPKEIFVKLVQPANASSLIVTTLSGITTLIKFVQSLNAP
jgi:hypothetical protein